MTSARRLQKKMKIKKFGLGSPLTKTNRVTSEM